MPEGENGTNSMNSNERKTMTFPKTGVCGLGKPNIL